MILRVGKKSSYFDYCGRPVFVTLIGQLSPNPQVAQTTNCLERVHVVERRISLMIPSNTGKDYWRMADGSIGLIGTLVATVSAAGLWLTGETGRILVAGGMGGLIRWLSTEKRRMRDGIIAIIGGVVTGAYMWPLGLHLPRLIGGDPFPETPSNIALSAFIVGTMGVSAVKIISAYIEARAAKMTGGKDDGQA